jgi:hypothetical protein
MKTPPHTQLNIQILNTEYEKLFDKMPVRKEALTNFRNFLETQTSWLTAPASGRFHLAIEKGLLMHSVGVALNALAIKKLLAPDISDESIILVALFHDVGKVGYPNKPYYIPNENTEEVKRGILYKTNPAIVHTSHAIRSLYLITRFVPITEQEVQAIVAHDGLYPLYGGVNNLDFHHRECRLQMILHFADKWTAAVIEENRT